MTEPRDTVQIPAVIVTPPAAEPPCDTTEPGAPDVPAPPEPQRVADTGLSESFLNELCLKHVYFGGALEAIELADNLRLDYRIVTALLDWLKQQELVTTRGGSGAFGGAKLRYGVTERGHKVVTEILARDNYRGPAPVPFAHFCRQVELQRLGDLALTADALERAFGDLVLEPEMLQLLGPAIIAARSLFLYGAPGNGKTAIAERIIRGLRGRVFVPYAVLIDNEIVRVYDPAYHSPEGAEAEEPTAARHDRRWVYSRRPAVSAGGELTLDMLEVVASPHVTYYEAPFQVKATSGVLFIDDFGRQRCDPAALLNRWTQALENQLDFLTFRSGHKARVPFDCLVVFSTNLDPRALADEAFLRRIRYKVAVADPTERAFKQIFRRECAAHGIAYDEAAVDHLLAAHYRARRRPLRACHPRDLVQQLRDIQRFTGELPPLTPATMDRVAALYFVGD
ncbi:MAG TPA: ATP-binding protein [Polyangia bacterium]|jgi:predicted ATPase with chaperone activity